MGFVPKLLTRLLALTALAAGAGFVAASSAGAADTVKVQRTIPFAATAQVPAAVRDSCQLQTKVPEFVRESAAGNVELVDGALNRKVGRVLEMQITDVHAPGGGVFSGGKSLTVKGELYDRGKLIGSFRARRVSGGGAFGAVKGTCSIIGRCTKTLGADIATWLAAPTTNAVLGDPS